ncbi:MAG: hypothetical protein HYW51_01550 [Candidatus Doudnabacteria bacterium]|nr:hypothetical protein [Candidatus Doudnabacteria bacterium]
MAKLETQINQIYLSGLEAKKSSIILYDEKLNATTQVFLLAQLQKIQKKTEASDLKKISEIVLRTLKANKKLTADALFETSLAQINEELADTAHKGRRGWLGKFSCCLALKYSDQIYLTNTGQVGAWLGRNSELLELLPAEEASTHPLKIFQNFMQGKIKEGDDLILTTTNVFNYVSFELFKQILTNTPPDDACLKISKILQDSAEPDEGYAAFMLRFGKSLGKTVTYGTEEEIYAPLPEDVTAAETEKKPWSFPGNLISRFKRLFVSIKIPRFKSYGNLSTSGKFFFISFILFVVLLALNLIVTGIRSANSRHAMAIDNQINVLVEKINETESSLLYNNQDQAFELLNKAQLEFTKLEKLDDKQASAYHQLLTDLYNKVNRVSTVDSPEIFLAFDQNPDIFARAGSGFIFANSSTQTVLTYSENLDSLFMLNTTSTDIKGLAHVENLGNYVISENQLYRINESLNQFDLVRDFAGSNLLGLAFLPPNRVYVIDKNTNQIFRLAFDAGGNASSQPFLTTAADLSGAVDVGVDNDVYVLFPDRLSKFSRGIEQTFELAVLTDPMTQASRIFIGTEIYILEPAKQRLIIFNKQGQLVNQIYFPNSSDLTDMYIDETERSLYLLDQNQLLKITY